MPMSISASMARTRSKSATRIDRPCAYSYVRFSTPEQARGESFRRQIEAARAYAAKNNLDLDESLRDEGVSAFRGRHRDERAALGAFLARVESGDIPRGSYLLVESLDRLSREEVVDALELFLGLTRNGIIIVTLVDQRVYSRESLKLDQTQLIISIVVMSRAHEESALKSKRVSDAWAAKRKRAAENGQAMTARCPAWLKLVGGPKSGKYETIDERVEIVRAIFADTIAGLGRRTIQSRLNAVKTETWGDGRKKGMFWHDSYIAKILSNPATYGRYAPLSKLAGGSDALAEAPIDGYFPAIIDEATFWAAQAASKARGSGKGTPGQRKNLLSGLVRCEDCGGTMVFIDKQTRGGGHKLRCGRAHASAGCEHRMLYDYKRIEMAVVFGLGQRRRALVEAAGDRQSQAQLALAAAQAQREKLQGQLDNLISLVQESGGSERVAKRVSALEAEFDASCAEVARLEREFKASRPVDVEHAAAGLAEVYRSLDAAKEDEDRLKMRASLQQRLKLLIKTIVLGSNGFVVTHSDQSTSRTSFQGTTRKMPVASSFGKRLTAKA